MTCVVSFIRAKTGGAGAASVGSVRKKEVVTVPGSTTITAEAGEIALVGNGETTMVLVAWGSTPDAVATSETSATTAGMPVAAGWTSPPLVMNAGDKVNIKAVA